MPFTNGSRVLRPPSPLVFVKSAPPKNNPGYCPDMQATTSIGCMPVPHAQGARVHFPPQFLFRLIFFLWGGKGTTPPLHTHQVCIITSLPFIFIFHHSLVPYREKHSLVPDSAPPKAAGTLNNAAEFAIARVDDLINWGRRVCAMFKFPILYLIKIEIMGKSTHRF